MISCIETARYVDLAETLINVNEYEVFYEKDLRSEVISDTPPVVCDGSDPQCIPSGGIPGSEGGVLDKWELGKTCTWLQLEYDYNYYTAIMEYTGDGTDAPDGWYSQEEVDSAQEAYDLWVICDNNTPNECGEAPDILYRPEDLPTVAEPPVLVPNTIEPYYEYYGWSEDTAYSNKMSEIDAYGENLIELAFAEPINGAIEDPIRHRKKLNRRRGNKADKLAGEIVLTEDEKLQSKSDEKLSEYEVKINDDQGKAETNLYKLSGVDNIMTFDVSAENWNVWVPPV